MTKKFKYQTVLKGSDLDSLGRDGWEAYAVDGKEVLLKRQEPAKVREQMVLEGFRD